MQKITGIYRITNTITGQCYIGQSVDIERRWKNHKSRANSKDARTPLYAAFKKFGVENFSFEILIQCPRDALDDWEKFYINQFDSTNEKLGYNVLLGGKGACGKHSLEWAQHISIGKTGKKIGPPTKEALLRRSAALKGIPRTDSWRKKISEKLKGRQITPEARLKTSATLKGRTLSPETKEKLRIASTGKTFSPETRHKISEKISKPVLQLNDAGQIIATFKSAREAYSQTGVNHTSISACCHGKYAHAGGFAWRFLHE